ncbi:hypothetical protein T492DRAFT_890441 [Pavlovales sp. CCMP2436]|nr:hypothetical protein T492DRAFT_890441 [Pavlovales sp. CCMP2436]
MSTRDARRAERRVEVAVAEGGGEEESEEEEQPVHSRFAGMLLVDSTEDEAEGSSDGVVAQPPPRVVHAARRRARRQGAGDGGCDDDWAALERTLPADEQAAGGGDGVADGWWVSAAWPLRPAYLTPEFELSERFGRRAVNAANAEIAAGRGGKGAARSGGRSGRRGVLAPVGAGALLGRARGSASLSLERDDEAYASAGPAGGSGLMWFRFRYSAGYLQLAEHASAAALAGDSRALQGVLKDSPAHVEALCGLASVCERSGHGELAASYLAAALGAYEAALGPALLLRGGLLDPRSGCHRTAAELCRLLVGLSFTPSPRRQAAGEGGEGGGAAAEGARSRRAASARDAWAGVRGLAGLEGMPATDPQRILLRVDAHLCRCSCLSLMRALPSLVGQGASLALYPNLSFSLALAHRAAGDAPAASAQLHRALCLYPAALSVLLLGADGALAETAARHAAEALLRRWCAALRAAGEASAAAPGEEEAEAREWEGACSPEEAAYRSLLLLYDAGVGAHAFRADTGCRQWLLDEAGELCDRLVRGTRDERGAAGGAPGGAPAGEEAREALALARDCAAFRRAEWASARAEFAGVSLDELGFSPLAQLPVDALMAEDDGVPHPVRAPAPPRPAGGLRLDLAANPLRVFLQSMLPWSYASRGGAPLAVFAADSSVPTPVLPTFDMAGSPSSERLLLDSVSRVCYIPLDIWTASNRGNLLAMRQIISLNALARAHYRRSIGTRGGAQASAAD